MPTIYEADIDRVIAQTGMGRMQAYYHLKGREAARLADERRRRESARTVNAGTFRSFTDIIRPIVANLEESR